jgi:hypothetical protein
MTANGKKAVSLIVAFAFLVMLLAQAMPLRADRAPDRGGTSVSSPEQGPSFVEEEGYPSRSGKKSIVPVLLIGLGVAALAAVLVLVVFKTKYNILGTWDFNFVSTSPAHTWTWTLRFRGDKKSGTFNDEYNDTGVYQVDGKNVTIKYDDWDIGITGQFDDQDRMSGNATFVDMTIGEKDINSATWTANRVSDAAAAPSVPQSQPAASRKAKK